MTAQNTHAMLADKLERLIQAQAETREQLERIADILERIYKYGLGT